MLHQHSQHKRPNTLKEHGHHDSQPYRLYLTIPTSLSNNYNEQGKHPIYHNIFKIVHAHIRGSES